LPHDGNQPALVLTEQARRLNRSPARTGVLAAVMAGYVTLMIVLSRHLVRRRR